MSAAISALKKSGAIKGTTGDDLRWAAYDSAVLNAGIDEEVALKSIAGCLETASKALHKKRKTPPTYRMHLEPDRKYRSSIFGATHKMDGGFLSIEDEASDPNMTSVALCIRWKNASSDEVIAFNQSQLLLADSNFLINNDPRRRFVFGLAIEGPDCSLWYYSRSHSAQSECFDWTANIRTFLDILLSFAFATPDQLGFDPAITLIPSPGLESFVYEVVDTETGISRFFHTQRSVSVLRSIYITGRATRVWEVLEVRGALSLAPIDPGKKMVLKDVWLNAEAKTEREIQRAIFKDVEDFKGRIGDNPPEFTQLQPEMQMRIRTLLAGDEYKQHFLTIACDSFGEWASSVPDNFERLEGNADLLDHLPLPDVSHPSPFLSTGTSHSTTGPCHPAEVQRTLPRMGDVTDRKFFPKRRYFIVFKELCEVVHDLATFKETVDTLMGGLYGLLVLFVAGWVHRDISTGNILRYTPSGPEDGRGILSDLEHAKRFPSSDGSGDAETAPGTAFFMADEIISRAPLRDILTNAPVTTLPQPTSGKRSALPPPPRHNFLHDLESLWWIFLWIITSRLPYTNPKHMAQVCVNCINPPSRERHLVFSYPGVLLANLQQYLDQSVEPLSLLVDAVRATMVFEYANSAPPMFGESKDVGTEFKSKVSAIYELLHQLLSSAASYAETSSPPIPLLRRPGNTAVASKGLDKYDAQVVEGGGQSRQCGTHDIEDGEGKKRAREDDDARTGRDSGSAGDSNVIHGPNSGSLGVESHMLFTDRQRGISSSGGEGRAGSSTNLFAGVDCSTAETTELLDMEKGDRLAGEHLHSHR